jgi:bacterial/archaeal transporter family-2 protein
VRSELIPASSSTSVPTGSTSGPSFREIVVLLGVMAIAGSLVAVQSRINGELAVDMGSSLGAATVSFGVGLAVISAIVLTKRRDGLRRLATTRTRWWFWLGGLGGAASAWALATAIPKIGVSLASVGLAAGMTSGGLFADRVGLGVFGRHRVTLSRLAGAALAVAAVTVSASSGLSSANQIQFVVFVVIGGFVTACQQPINGTLAHAVGDALVATFVSFAVGFLALSAVLLVEGPTLTWPGELWLYLGGGIAATYVMVATSTVGRLGALRLSLATIGGQLTMAAVLDVVAPVEGQQLTAFKVVGAVLAFGAVALASGIQLPHRNR